MLFEAGSSPTPATATAAAEAAARAASGGVEVAEDEDEVLFEVGQAEPEARPDAALERSETEKDEEEDSSPLAAASEAGELLRTEGLALPVLGASSLTFDAVTAARYVCDSAGRGSSSELTVPPQLRRLLWMRWLGVIRCKSPQEWLVELRPRREEFLRLLEEARSSADSQSPEQAKISRLIRLDVARCFSEESRLGSQPARVILRQVLEVHALRHRSRNRSPQAYCQGYHEIAAVMLLVCIDGTWPKERDEQGLLSKCEVSCDEGDLAVYRELSSPDSVAADTLALLEALLYDCRLADMYETEADAEEGAEPPIVVRCRRITTGLRRVAPDLAMELEKWNLAPHVLLLGWVRLLFLREFSFPAGVLTAWDLLFADAQVWHQSQDGPPWKPDASQEASGALPSSVALPLADFLALAMIIASPPTKPEEILRFSERRPDVRRLLALACQLRQFAAESSSGSQQAGGSRPSTGSSSAAQGGGDFPQPPPAAYPSGMAGGRAQQPRAAAARRSDGKDRYTLGESLGSTVFGQALGWAASRLSTAVTGVLGDGSDCRGSAEARREARLAAERTWRRPPPSPTVTEAEADQLHRPPLSTRSDRPPLSSRSPSGSPEQSNSMRSPVAFPARARNASGDLGADGTFQPPAPPAASGRQPRNGRFPPRLQPTAPANGRRHGSEMSWEPSSPSASEASFSSQARFPGIFSAAPATATPEPVFRSPALASIFPSPSPSLPSSSAPVSPEVPPIAPQSVPFWAAQKEQAVSRIAVAAQAASAARGGSSGASSAPGSPSVAPESDEPSVVSVMQEMQRLQDSLMHSIGSIGKDPGSGSTPN